MSTKENNNVELESETPRRSFIPPDDDTKHIKNIYVDRMTLNLTSTNQTGSVSLKPSHRRRPSSVEPVLKSGSDIDTKTNIQRRFFADDMAKEPSKKNLTAVNGRTRGLVEKFEKRDKLDTDEYQKPDLTSHILPNTNNVSPTTVTQPINVVSYAIPEAKTSPKPLNTPRLVPQSATSPIPVRVPDIMPRVQPVAKTSQILLKTTELVVQTPKISPNMVCEKVKGSPIQRSRRVIPEKVRTSPMSVARRSRVSCHVIPERTRTSPHVTTDKARFSLLLEDNPQTTGRCMTTKDDLDEDLMLDHELFITTLRSRLTKLQAVHHFWKQNDMSGAIITLQKLPDHAVQADVISVILENIESVTLDLFSCLLPLLLGLLDSDTERHINVSLEMLLKLVAVFGPVINSTISSPPSVGVNLQAEKRLECCSQCHVQLQKIHKSLHNVIRRGGLTARSAQQLNLLFQQS